VALARRLYVEEVPVATIMAETGIRSTVVLYRCLDGYHDDGSGAPLPLPALPRRCQGLGGVRSKSRRGSVIARVWQNAEAQVRKIEARLEQSGLTSVLAAERDARALAVLVRTLRELSALAEMRKPSAKKEPKPEIENDDDPIPADLDEFRRALARRMQGLIETRTRGGVSG
jgi:hypothetical protein